MKNPSSSSEHSGVTPGLSVAIGSAFSEARELEMLREREQKCPTMLEAEARALVRALQEIADITGMLPSASPRQIVERVRHLSQNSKDQP